MDMPLKNLASELVLRKAKTNESLRAEKRDGLLAPYGETIQAALPVDTCNVAIVSAMLPKATLRDKRHVKIRTMASKLSRHSNAIAARVHTIAHMRADGSYETQVIMDHPDNDIAPRDPAWKTGLPKVATPRKDSPFKRAGKSAASVVIVRKA